MIFTSILDLDAAPTKPSMAFPFFNIAIVGMLCIPKAPATVGFSSTFTLPNTTFPASSLASCSMTGETILQGPHQGAQKSTTKRGYFPTSLLKLESVNKIGESMTTVDALLLPA